MKKIASSLCVVALASVLFVGCNKPNDVIQPQSHTAKSALAARYFLDEQPVVKEATEKAPHVHLFIDAEGRENYHAFTSEEELIKWALSSDDESTRLVGEKRQLAQEINQWKERTDLEGQLARKIQESMQSKILPADDETPVDEEIDTYAYSEEEIISMIPVEYTKRLEEIDSKIIDLHKELSPVKGGRTSGVGAGNWYDGYNYTGANLISGWFLTKPVGAGVYIRIFGRKIWIIKPASWNDRISSLNYYTVLALYICYENNWYQGQSQSFSSATPSGQDYPNFGMYNMDNKISSIL